MSLYQYNGPPSGVTLTDPVAAREILLHPGHTYELPDDNTWVQHAVELGALTPLVDAVPTTPEVP